jgi:hypothetical protein
VRETWTGRTVMAGCFDCWGYDAHWFTNNGQALAARHHDATGHSTWADVYMNVRYGSNGPSETAPVAEGR